MIASALLFLLAARDESVLRAEFEKGFKAPEVAARVSAVGKLHGVVEEKTVRLLAAALKDSAKEVRQAAASALETAQDRRGVALDELGKVLNTKDESPEIRLACARALIKSPYQLKPIRKLLDCMAGIGPEDKDLHRFGAEVTGLLDKRVGKSFGAEKTTVERWENWWTDNQARLKAEDEKVRKSSD